MNAHASFFHVWMYLERNTYTTPRVDILSFATVISKFISVDKMKELVRIKDLSYSDVSIMLQEKNPHAKGISEISVSRYRLISENNQISVKKNFTKQSFCRHQRYDMEIMIHGIIYNS